MGRTDITQRGGFSPPALTLSGVLLALAAALVAVALLVASYRVGSLYSPMTFLLAGDPAVDLMMVEPKTSFA